MIRAGYTSHILRFYKPAGTSRGVLQRKPAWYIRLTADRGAATGIGEVTYIPGLSPGSPESIESGLAALCGQINRDEADPAQTRPGHPGIRFALETALRDLEQGGRRELYSTGFSAGREGIPVNGLIWMGDRESILAQVRAKLEEGFRVLKLKVGALDFNAELEILREVRCLAGTRDLELRLDANGAWDPGEASEKLARLAAFEIHSVEQPVRPGQPDAMAALCQNSPIPVALDEELIGVTGVDQKAALLKEIRPAYLILKPGLTGGWREAGEWIALADANRTGWWITSALESNIGLNAIAQWTAWLGVKIPQGLGTGLLYANNIPSPLEMDAGFLWHRPSAEWNLEILDRK